MILEQMDAETQARLEEEGEELFRKAHIDHVLKALFGPLSARTRI